MCAKTILYVEDNETNLRVVRRLLNGYRVIHAADGETALKALSAQSPPDLVLLDINLPGLSGFEIVGRVPDGVPVVAHTAAGDDEAGIPIRDQVMALGCTGYIPKPVGRDFRARVEAYLAGQRDEPPSDGRMVRALRAYSQRVVDRLIARQRELERLLEERRFFAAAAAHELRTPVTSLALAASILLQMKRNEDEETILREMQRTVVDLQRRVGDLLLLTQIEQGQILSLQPVDLGQAVRAFTQRHERTCDACTLDVSTPDGVMVFADPERLEQVLDNLVGNAHKFAAPDRPLHIQIQVEKGQERAVISIKDNGIGISTGDLPRIFDPFTRLSDAEDQAVPGLGLGLAIVKRLVELMGGDVWAASRKGEGAAFMLALPYGQEER